MNIIEALKSGRRFQRPRHSYWFTGVHNVAMRDSGGLKLIISDDHFFNTTPEDILADDWKLEEKKVEITKAQLWHAYAVALKLTENEMCINFNALAPLIKSISIELGLED